MKETALTLLRIALTLFPPLATFLTKALETYQASTDEEKDLLSLVREILPSDAPIHQAVRELERDQGV